MSVFKVSLTNQFGGPVINPQQGQDDARLTGQGNLDEAAQDSGVSIQRTVYVMGPNKINRKLNDGDTFTDCNYWKRFAYPAVPVDQAIVSVVTDDGSVYVDGENNGYPIVYTATVGTADAYSAHLVNILVDTGNAANFVTITESNGNKVLVRLNGLSNAAFTLAANATITFNKGDLAISTIEFAGGGAGTSIVQVIAGVDAVCHS